MSSNEKITTEKKHFKHYFTIPKPPPDEYFDAM